MAPQSSEGQTSEIAQAVATETPRRRVSVGGRLWRMARAVQADPRLAFGGVLVALLVVAVFAPVFAPYPPLLYHPAIATQPHFGVFLSFANNLVGDDITPSLEDIFLVTTPF